MKALPSLIRKDFYVRYQTIGQLLSRELFGLTVISIQSTIAILGTVLEVSMAVGPRNTHSLTSPSLLNGLLGSVADAIVPSQSPSILCQCLFAAKI